MRRSRVTLASSSRGFTLLEMVVALTISAIVIGMTALVVTVPVNSFFDTSERAERTDAADLVIRRLDADLKRALPNSVRISTNGNRAIIEMLVYESMSFYRVTGELPGPGPWSQTERELDPTQIDTQFSVFGRMSSLDPDPMFIAINNQGDASTLDAYRPNNRVMTPVPVDIGVTSDDTLDTLEQRLEIVPGFRFQNAAATNSRQRVFFVTGPVTYICNTAPNARAIRRFEGYAIANTMPTAENNARLVTPGVGNSLVANNVSECRLRCDAGASNARPCLNGLVVEFTIDRATSSGNENVRVFQQFPVDNSL